jgi:hypothetical protein
MRNVPRERTFMSSLLDLIRQSTRERRLERFAARFFRSLDFGMDHRVKPGGDEENNPPRAACGRGKEERDDSLPFPGRSAVRSLSEVPHCRPGIVARSELAKTPDQRCGISRSTASGEHETVVTKRGIHLAPRAGRGRFASQRVRPEVAGPMTGSAKQIG